MPPARVSIDNEYYEGMDELWWDPAGPAAILHAINRPRVGFYLGALGDLGGRLVLDAGCGGGLVARELAAAGAGVVGIDRSLGSLGVARRAVGAPFRPAQGRLERLPFATGSFDAVVAADVLEHLPDLPAAVAELARVLAPGGSFLFDTINRTPWAWFTAVFGLEQVLRIVPRGTHDWRLFIRPAELDRLLRRAGLEPVELCGLAPQIGPGWSPRAAHPPHRHPELRHRQRAPRLLPRALPKAGGSGGSCSRRRQPPDEKGFRMIRLQALGTAMPDHYVFKQSEIVEAFFAGQPGWDPAFAEVFANSGVERRASVVDPAWYTARPRTTADRMREFAPAARKLGAEAARRALERAGPGAAAEVGDLLAVSCTGYSGPGLDVHLVDDLGLGDRVQRLAIGHMGCYAALPALRTAAALAAASGRRALVTCVELCTLHTQAPRTREDAVYLALFGDGAAAALVGPGGGGPVIVGSARVTVPGSEERMGWLVEDEGFRMWLSPGPGPGRAGCRPAGRRSPPAPRPGPCRRRPLGRPPRRPRDHRPGPAALRARRRPGRPLPRGAGRRRQPLLATVLFILEQLLASGEVEPGQWIVALAFGTGLTLEALLLQA